MDKRNDGSLCGHVRLVAVRWLYLLLFTCLVQLTGLAWAGTITGRVVGVSDGDTVTVLDLENIQHKIRLAGIDAPEKKMPFGNRAKDQLSDLVFDKQVKVETGKIDRYGRTVGVIFVNGRDANLAMVNAGLAWHYKQYQNEQTPSDRLLYARAEEQARLGKFGLWRDINPIAPWEYRKRQRQN